MEYESEKASIVAGIMIVFLCGEELLNLIGIDVNSFAVAGSFVYSFGTRNDFRYSFTVMKQSSASIVPLAFPLIAGAGTMTTLLSLRSQFSP
jgi:multiple antibiotic resistance protein